MKKHRLASLVFSVFVLLGILVFVFGVSSCTDAKVVSNNLSKAADMFEMDRRIIFYNGITGEYMMTIEGRCSITADTMDGQLEVVCRTGNDSYKKHFLGLSDNVTYFAEQLESKGVSKYHYRVIFKPKAIVPDIDLR
jgi:hypothetical protein